jgi:cytochrome c biogenesis protein CcmG/thiol:disulfide interchange protein DsbE
MIRAILPIAIFSVLAGFLYVGLYKDPSLVPSPLIGKPIPSFQLSTLQDADAIITQDNFKGEIALINVWGTWCIACKQEHAALVYIADKKNIPIYGLNYKDDRELAKQWLVDYGDPYVMSAFDASGRIAIDFGVYGAPETFLIDDKGIIRHKLVGIMTADVWEHQFVPKIQLIKQGQ